MASNRMNSFSNPKSVVQNLSFHSMVVAAFLVRLLAGCKPAPSPSAAKAFAPAKVVTENDLATITLKLEAEQRLGITTAPLEVKKVERSRTLGGELLLPLGRAEDSSNSPPASSESIYSLLSAMTLAELVRVGEMQIDADGKVAAALVELDAAKVALERAQNLVASSAGTLRGVDEARARMQLAKAVLHTARERRALLGAPLFDATRQDVL
jgi:cobalt-zinc-cadmium efflux system membrane fusion protein